MGASAGGYLSREPQVASAKTPRTTPPKTMPLPRRGSVQDWALNLQRSAGNQAVTSLLQANDATPSKGASDWRSGRPLDPATRLLMETRLGHHFGDVRIHSSVEAMQAARRVHARAFTVGHDIVFGANAPSPQTKDGRRVLVHELAHVVQQRTGALGAAEAGLDAEREADAAATAVTGGNAFAVQTRTGVTLARQPEDLGPPTLGNLPLDTPDPLIQERARARRVQLVQQGDRWVEIAAGRTAPTRTAKGAYNFVVMADGTLWAVKASGPFGHTEAALGGRVRWAGNITFTQSGQLKTWSNASGHYLPSRVFAANAGLPMGQFVPLPPGPAVRPGGRRQGPQLPMFQPQSGQATPPRPAPREISGQGGASPGDPEGTRVTSPAGKPTQGTAATGSTSGTAGNEPGRISAQPGRFYRVRARDVPRGGTQGAARGAARGALTRAGGRLADAVSGLLVQHQAAEHYKREFDAKLELLQPEIDAQIRGHAATVLALQRSGGIAYANITVRVDSLTVRGVTTLWSVQLDKVEVTGWYKQKEVPKERTGRDYFYSGLGMDARPVFLTFSEAVSLHPELVNEAGPD